MNTKKLLVVMVAVATLFSCRKDISEQNNTSLLPQQTADNQLRLSAEEYVPNELLIKFNPGFADRDKLQALKAISGSIAEKIFTKAMEHFGEKEGVYLIHTPIAVANAINLIKLQKLVAFAEPNYVYHHDAVSTDPYFTNGSLWGMYGDASTPANQYGSQAAEAWGKGHTGSSSVYVGIIDEGYMYAHEDISANAATNPGEIAGNGIDDDRNGYVDDVNGWDFDSNDNTVFDGIDDDHGTHVAGTIGAVGGNSIGVAGVCWNIRILNAKFLGVNGGTTANAVKAVDYMTDLKTREGLNIVATNNSWGGGGFSQALQDAITRAGNANILFVAAAGNSGHNIDATPSYPASYNNSNIISVAAIDNRGAIASWSNYGTRSVDLGAPGVGIYSTLPASSGNIIVSSYGSYSGTSMATPHVTGAVALYASTHPGVSAATIKSAILSSVAATSSLRRKTVTGGRLNVSGF